MPSVFSIVRGSAKDLKEVEEMSSVRLMSNLNLKRPDRSYLTRDWFVSMLLTQR